MTPARPNIVLIVSDDHGYGDFTRFGRDARIRTPNLDRLAAGGVSCTNAYVTAPVCSPSRAALISGTHQARWGVTWFGDSSFPDHLPSLAERLRAMGYATGYWGKVHYGREQLGNRACPDRHGFDESYYGLAGNQQGRLNYLRHSAAAVDEYGDEASWRMAVLPMVHNGSEEDFEGFLTPELGRRACDFITSHANAGQPFFAMVAFNAVHNFNFQLPESELSARGLPRYGDWVQSAEPYDDWYARSIWPHLDHGREYYLAQLDLMDAQVGRILDTLDDRGIADDTLVVYLTDNGGSTCNYGDNTPLRGGKYTLWEGGIRVPFLVRWPNGGITGGESRDHLVSSLDLYPSLLAAAGGNPALSAHADGIDQLATWRGHTPVVWHDALHWEAGFQWAVREGDWKLHVVHHSRNVAHLAEYEHAPIAPGTMLVNLAADPSEATDVSAQHPHVAERLRRRHRKWREDVGMDAPDIDRDVMSHA